MASTGAAFLRTIRSTLNACIALSYFPSMNVERYTTPEVEYDRNKELLGRKIVIARTPKEKVLIEPSINSLRFSVTIRQNDGLDTLLVDRFASFLMTRADQFQILRKKPVEGYDLSFLIMHRHLHDYDPRGVVDWICDFMKNIDKEVSEMKLGVNNRAREIASQLLTSMYGRK
ncbi:hypothetical protein PCE1_005019 [Barthelona sp. PCE]